MSLENYHDQGRNNDNEPNGPQALTSSTSCRNVMCSVIDDCGIHFGPVSKPGLNISMHNKGGNNRGYHIAYNYTKHYKEHWCNLSKLRNQIIKEFDGKWIQLGESLNLYYQKAHNTIPN